MLDEVPDILASRLNFDVVVYRGNTRSEMMVIGFLSMTLTILLLGSLTQFFFHTFFVGVGLSFPTAIPVGWLFSILMQKLKSQKPKGYVKQQVMLCLARHGIRPSPFVTYSGAWSIRRILK